MDKAPVGQVQRPGPVALTDTQMDKIAAGGRVRDLNTLTRGFGLLGGNGGRGID